MGLFDENNQRSKISWHCLFNKLLLVTLIISFKFAWLKYENI
jgi:hypothetical protein